MSLTQDIAKQRSAIIRKNSIEYNFHIILEEQKFHGLAQFTFYIDNLNFQILPIDFTGQSVEDIIVNTMQLSAQRSLNFIFIPRPFLQKGKNRISIMYSNTYDIDTSGLIAFQDNGSQFVFTHFEPYSANRVFPCFDQPNLKATMKLTVIAPQKWKVISNQKLEDSSQINFQQFQQFKLQKIQKINCYKLLSIRFHSKAKQQTKIWTFYRTELLSTYLYCLAAGEFHQLINTKGPVPMSIFFPPSFDDDMSRYSSFIFDITIKCMNFYQTYFDIDYPFSKYDQVWVSQFRTAAMENAGLVIFNRQDCPLKISNPTQLELYQFALLISHEQSHHWFGDYFTMDWWDDLWLKESFAEFISCYSIQKLQDQLDHRFQSPYAYFRQNKCFGYQQDERNMATHPIREPVEDTDIVLSIFDGITYEKGAAVLKQLMVLIGEANFSKALHTFLDRFALSNATIDDFLVDISQYFPADLTASDWRQMWLLKPSLNVFQAIWNPNDTSITAQIIVKQRPFSDQHNHLRYHLTSIGLYNNKAQLVQQLTMVINNPTNTISYDGSKSIQAILVNNGDETFAENILDPVSLNFFMKNIDKVTDTLARTVIWFNIQSMVKQSLISITDYLQFIQNKLFGQAFNLVLEKMLETLLIFTNQFLIGQSKAEAQTSIFNRLYKQLQIAKSDSPLAIERIQIIEKYLVQFAFQRSQIEITLVNWFYGTDKTLAMEMPTDQRWSTVIKNFELIDVPIQQKNALFQYAKKLDNSKSDDIKIICDAILANQAQFQIIYNQFKQNTLAIRIKELKIQGWKNYCHYEIIYTKYRQRYFQDILSLSETLNYQSYQFFYSQLIPIDDEVEDQIKRYTNIVDQLSKRPNLKQHCKNIKKIIDDLTVRSENMTFNVDINTALTQIRAIDRYNCIQQGSIIYNYHITFLKDTNYYVGMAQISFNLSVIPKILPLDCISSEIKSITVNGYVVKSISNGQFLMIPRVFLAIGFTYITIQYKNLFNNDGLGCMSYTQTVSTPHSQYVYTKFQPYGAHRFMPCFDQPDLKATATFNVILPNQWIAIANQPWKYTGTYSLEDYLLQAPTKSQEELIGYLANKQGSFYVFPNTKLLPTYLFCLIAGQYFSVSLPVKKQYHNIPMSLYCIKSYSTYLENLADFIFQMTIESIKFYQAKFQVDYKFSKYDSVFCHEFKSGAMENPGVITFRDTYLYPQKVSTEKMLAFALVIIHQNAHNWFGNYVTMKWWNDLWLNQSFADLVAYYCLENIKGNVTTVTYDSGWKFFLSRIVDGYREDQITATTHPIRSQVPNTSLASAYFDSITYKKGSSVLKQLMFLMGQDNFFKGVNEYFRDFGWKNGTIDDFLLKMQGHFDIEQFTLTDWKRDWLQTPSLNIITVDWNPKDTSQESVLNIKQAYYSEFYPRLRYHKTKIAMFKSDATYDILNVLISPTEITSITYDGSKGYVAVLVNESDWGHFMHIIDPISKTFFTKNINKIDDSLTRLIIWNDLNQSLRHIASKQRVDDFTQFFLQYIYQQTDDLIFEFQNSFIKEAIDNFVSIPNRANLKSKIFGYIYTSLIRLLAVNDRSNRIILMKNLLTSFAVTEDQIDLLQKWREGVNHDLDSQQITMLQAWEVVKLVFTSSKYPLQVKNQIYNDQYATTPGVQGQLIRNTCNAIAADSSGMATNYNIFKSMAESLDVKRSYAQGWNHPIHLKELQQAYKTQYFANIPILSHSLISNHFQLFYSSLKPIDDNLQQTIKGYDTIKLEGGDMIGHSKKIQQIKYSFWLRLQLYQNNL